MVAETMAGAAPGAATARRTRFYLWMAVAMAATAFLGFAPTYWVPMAQGVPERIGVLAVHGTLYFGWTLFVIYQAWLVGSGHVVRHRDVGLIGVSLATAMVIFGVLAAINSAVRAIGLNAGAAGEAFMIVPLSAVLSFGVLVIAAILNIRRPEWHKRLMLAATAVILEAPIARPFIVYLVMGGHPPPFHGPVGLAGFGGPPPPVLGVLPPALIACCSSWPAWFGTGACSAASPPAQPSPDRWPASWLARARKSAAPPPSPGDTESSPTSRAPWR